MSLMDKVLEALRSAILLEARVTNLAGHVAELATEMRDIDRRLVRLETLTEVNAGRPEAMRSLPKRGGER